MELAIKEKLRLEETQRERRKEMETNKIKFKPVYFEEKVLESTGEKIFYHTGKYWEDRA